MTEANTQGAVIAKLKVMYGKLLKVSFGEDEFLIRRLKRQEHSRIISLVEQIPNLTQRAFAEALEEKVTETAVVWPPIPADFASTSPTGYVPVLASAILNFSGFDQKNVFIEEV